jgi:hypothetical protein
MAGWTRDVQVGEDLLNKPTKTLVDGLAELIGNSLDADARTVDVVVEPNALEWR